MTEEPEIQFPINQSLLEEATRLKKERRLIIERIEKIEAKKAEVSSKVYEKVRQDYTNALAKATNALLEKKAEIDRELATLYETRSKVAKNHDQHKESLEELGFRHQLGEYDDTKYEQLSEGETEKLEKFEKLLNAINSNIEKYESIFADEEGILEELEEEEEPSAEKKKPAPKPVEEGSEYIIAPEEEDYFTPKSTTAEHTLETTNKVTITPNAAKLLIIEGEGTGTEYELQKECTIGRATTNMIPLKDSKVSRQHAVIKKAGNEFAILDLNSSNGIYVNNERVKEQVLNDGDMVQIGDFVLQFKI